MLSRTAVLPLTFLACASPVAPIATDSGADPDAIRLSHLREGQTLTVDFHSQGCFASSDAHLVFEVGSGEVLVSGWFRMSGLRNNPGPAELASHYLTPMELVQLNNMLNLYRREERQTYCWSTGKHTTTLRLTDLDGSMRSEHYVTDSCIEYTLSKVGDLTTMRPRANMLFFNDLTRPLLKEMIATAR